MSGPAKPKSDATKKRSPKTVSEKENHKKPLHEALGPAAKDFGVEIKPLGQEVGELTVKTVRTLLIKPLTSTIWGLEHVSEWVSRSVSNKLAGKSQEEIKEPDPRIALPTLQALIYSGKDEEIREMFANLLACGMTKEASAHAHPAFVELIKQMTSTEAQVLSHIAENRHQAVFEVKVVDLEESPVFYTIAKKISFELTNKENTSEEDLIVCLSNLERLGLLVVDASKHPNHERLKSEKADILSSYAERIDKDKYSLSVDPYGIYMTSLGERFVKVCLTEKSDTSSQKTSNCDLVLEEGAG